MSVIGGPNRWRCVSTDGESSNLLAELEDADVVIMVATTEADAAAATIIGAACTVRAIMTAGLVIGEPSTDRRHGGGGCARMRGC